MLSVHHIVALWRQMRIRFEIEVIRKRFSVIHHLGKPVSLRKRREKVLIVIPHVVVNTDPSLAPDYVQRLYQCLTNINISLAAYEKKIILLTKEGCTLHEQLPKYLIDIVFVYYSDQSNPMHIEFDAMDAFLAYDDQSFDYFLFLEDDIIINDAWFIEKIKWFNNSVKNNKYLLLPHRYEYADGIKYYLDQMTFIGKSSENYHYFEAGSFSDGLARYSIFENPHAAMYCINRDQLSMWQRNGYLLRNQLVAIGDLESAATFSHMNIFEFFNPHPNYVGYLEVMHLGNKYIKQHNKF